MTDRCMVSVMCLAYNHEKYIREALDSMIGQQTDFPYEILINDDASTDATADIIREYEARYPDKIRAFYQEKNIYSRGISIEDTVLLPAVRGKYTAFCEGDDRWTDPTKLQRQVDFLEAHPEYSACAHNTVLTYCSGQRADEKLLAHNGDCDIDYDRIIPGMRNALHTSALMGRSDILAHRPDYYFTALAHGFSDQPDVLWLRENGKIRYLDRCMSVYRINSGAASWSSGVDGQYEKLTGFITGVIEMLRQFRTHVTDSAVLELTDRAINEHMFQLLYTQGRDRELRQPPYRDILRQKPLSFRVKNLIKCGFPALTGLYRRSRGYRE